MKINSILDFACDKKDILKIIAENMIKTRPSENVCLKPYYNSGNILSKNYAGGTLRVDLKELFPQSNEGDHAYFKTNIYTNEKHTVSICVKGKTEVFYKNEKIAENAENESSVTEVLTEAGENELVIKVYRTKNEFGFSLAVSPPPFPWNWSNDYLMWNKMRSPIKEFREEEGFIISPLYSDECCIWDGTERCYPPEETDDKTVDFCSIFKEQKDKLAIALSECVKDGYLNIKCDENTDIYFNGKKATATQALNIGDRVITVSKCVDGNWGFVSECNDILGIDKIVNTERKYAHWLILGYFDDDKNKDNIAFDKIYKTSDNKYTFWRFVQKDTYLRPYLDTCFYGQWYYALMVGHYGILNVSDILGEKYLDYFKSSMSVIAKYFEYMQYEKDIFYEPAFLSKSWYLDNFDSIGSIGMNLCEYYKLTKDEKAIEVINILVDSIYKNIPQDEEGLFYRHPKLICDGIVRCTMWADDSYMSCPFFVRLGDMFNDDRFYKEAAVQLIGLFKKLYMEDEMLLRHIYFLNDDKQNNVPWGRGNGWMFYTLADVIERIPDNSEYKDELHSLYNKLLEGIVKNVGETGMWHQVLNSHDSYIETSCSAMFVAGIAKGIKNGWIDELKYKPIVIKAIDAILKNAVDNNGCIYGVCKGSGCHWNSEYYKELGTVVNDDHGTGILLSALCEALPLYD